MAAAITLRPTTADARPIAERLWQLYVHDLSEFRGSMPFDDGLFKLGRLPTYFDDPDRAGFFIEADRMLAGFVFVSGLTGPMRTMAEFFVVRAARRRHVGGAAARAILRQYPGAWQIPFQEENPAAARFWRSVAADVSAGPFREERRPVPNKPEIPPDTWLLLTV
jgi:predicted acetyltransferase